jgi:hypothetical protein
MRRLFALVLLAAVLAAGKIALATPFEFTLSEARKTSAGVFSADGRLIRTLWSGVPFPAGAHNRIWDGKDDLGRLAVAGNYQIRVLSGQTSYVWEGVVGNTSNDWSGPGVFHFMTTPSGMAITGGNAYIATGYNEGYTSQARFAVGDTGAKTFILGKGAQFMKVATDGSNVYWAGDDANRADDGFVMATVVGTDAQTSFSSGGTYAMTYGMAYSSAIDVIINTAGAEPTGLAVQQSHNYLFVARAGMNSLHVLHKGTGAVVHNLTFTAPGDLAIDPSDNLWMIHTVDDERVVQRFTVNSDGTLSAGVVITGLSAPLAIANNGTLIVADGDDSQQVKAFNSSGSPLWTLGDAGGYASSPLVSNSKFDFQPNLEYTGGTFVAFAADGSFWVGDIGCYRVQHYASSLGFVDQIAYVPTFYSAAADPNAPTRVFANFLEYEIDYGVALGPRNGSWVLKRNWRPGVPPGYDSLYARMKYVATLSNGRTYAVLNGTLFELPPTGHLRNTGIAVSYASSFYPDGSLRRTDGGLYVETWDQKTLTGFDGSNNPLWSDWTNIASAPIDEVSPRYGSDGYPARIAPITSSGVLVSYDFLAQLVGPVPNKGWHLGGVQSGSNAWLWRASPSGPANYLGNWPTDGTFDIGNYVGNAGGAVMTVDRHVIYGYRGENWKGVQTNKYRHYYDDGLMVAEFGPTAYDSGLAEAAPAMAGNAASNWVVKLEDGRAFMYHNDESWHGGLHRWRIDGLSTVGEQTTSINWQPDMLRGLHAEYFDSADWNSLYRRSSRQDASIDFSWGTGVPTGTDLSDGDSFSVRWTGFVVAQYSEAYTFKLEADDWGRVRVDGTLVTSGAGTQTGSIALVAGVAYPIEVEYREDTGSAGVSLKWSSSSVSEEVIPAARLGYQAEGVDLLHGLPASGAIADGTAGWKRTPESNLTDYWHSWYVDGGTHGNNPYLHVHFRDNTENTSAEVTRDLGVPADTTARWELSMMVSYASSYNNHGTCGGQYMDVLDDADKVIARLYPVMITYPTDSRLYGNTGVIVQAPESTLMWSILAAWAPLRIIAEDGQVTFQYDGYDPVVTSVFDPTANWRRAKTLRFSYWTGPSYCAYNRMIDVDALRFNVTPGTSSVDPLMKGIPLEGPIADANNGWHRSPATDNGDYWHTWLVDGGDLDGAPAVHVFFRDSTEDTSAFVTRDLGVPSDATARWDLSMMVSYAGNYNNHGSCGGQYMDVLDDADKVIARLYQLQVAYPNDSRVYGNTEAILQTSEGGLMALSAAWLPLRITAAGGQVTFAYGSYDAITTDVFDPTSNWRRPKTLRLSYWTGQCAYPRRVHIADLKMQTDGSSTPFDLLAGLRADSSVASAEYGWTVIGAMGTPDYWDSWTVKTNTKTWEQTPPVDVGMFYRRRFDDVSNSVSRDLGPPSNDTARWEIAGRINYEDSYPNHVGTGGQYLDVLDDSDRIIARFYPTQVGGPNDCAIRGNTSVIAMGSEAQLLAITSPWQPIRISAENGQVTFAYADFVPNTTTVFDEEADWRRAKTLRLTFFTTTQAGAYPRSVHLDDLTYTVVRSQ